MDQIDPTSLALLSVLAATVVVIALWAVISRVQDWVERRRWQVEDVTIDLTFLQGAIERDREQARDLSLRP